MDEYIEREAALNIVNGWRDQLIPTYGKNDEYVKCLETVAEHLELLHAADVRPVVRGKWEKRMEQRKGNGYEAYTPVWKCSVCGKDYDPATALIVNYCYNCGADMRGET